jgi:cell division protein FtsB
MATTPPDIETAYTRLRKAALRSRAVVQLTAAIKSDLQSLPKESEMARRSVKVLDYMRGYTEAVAKEELAARTDYEEVAYQTKRRARLAQRRRTKQEEE